MEHYVTLFDSFFLPQGMALHASMERHVRDYTLWVLCVDDGAFEVLARLGLPRVRLLKLSQLETEALVRVKLSRSIAEYCWTLTPFVPRFVFEADESVQKVTYIDADIWFTDSPHAVHQELALAGKSVLITEHGYAPQYDRTEFSGKYCVQFISFTRAGENVRKWWEDRCIEWCFDRHEDGKFGDQKYLEQWPKLFADQVHVLQQKSLLLAPWNAVMYPHSGACLYHFHGTRTFGARAVTCGPYQIPYWTRRAVHRRYGDDIENGIRRLGEVGHQCRPQIGVSGLARLCFRNLVSLVKQAFREFCSYLPIR